MLSMMRHSVRIYELEITNHCQFNCRYCPSARYMTRKRGVISKRMIDRVGSVISYPFISLNHHGESLIYPDLVLYATGKFSRLLHLRNMEIEICTNGEFLTPYIAESLFDEGMSNIKVSYHNERSIKHLKEISSEFRNRIEVTIVGTLDSIENYKKLLNPLKNLGYRVGIKLLRDFGQIKKDSKDVNYKSCSFLKNNEMIVHYNGDICVCCECYNGEEEEILGNVMDDILPERNRIIQKCYTCIGYGNTDEETEVVFI